MARKRNKKNNKPLKIINFDPLQKIQESCSEKLCLKFLSLFF